MNLWQKISIVGLRVSLGSLFFYAGFSKILNPDWSAGGFLQSAKTFPEFYTWFAQPDILPITNLLNEWGLTIVGLLLIFGLGTKLASWLGIILMTLYYFPGLDFPYLDHAFLIDDHIIYIFAFLVLITSQAGQTWSVWGCLAKYRLCCKSAFWRAFWS